MKVFNINDSYFKYQKCLSGITYQFVNQLDNIYEKNLMVGTNYCIYCMYNEFDIINNFMINLNQVDVCSTNNLDLTQRYYSIDGANLRTGHKVILVNQNNPSENDIYTVDTRGFLILSDELATSGQTWRYKAYVKLGTNKGKQFHLKNSGNRFPLKGERKYFLDGHGYIVKNLFNYDLFVNNSVNPKLIFTDYELARISVNKNYELYTGFSLPTFITGDTVDIQYHDNSYIISVDDDTTKYISTGITSGTTIYNSTTGFTYIEADPTFISNASVYDYIQLDISGSTNLYLKTFIKEIGSTSIIISDYISDHILYTYYTGSTSTYTLTNLMYSPQSTVKETMLESFYSKYFNIDSSNNLNTIENINNRYFDYDGLTFVFSGSTNATNTFQTPNHYIKYNLYDSLNLINPSLFNSSYSFLTDYLMPSSAIEYPVYYDITDTKGTYIKITPSVLSDTNFFRKNTYVNLLTTSNKYKCLIVDLVPNEYFIIESYKSNSGLTATITGIETIYNLQEISNILYDVYINDTTPSNSDYYRIREDSSRRDICNAYADFISQDLGIISYVTAILMQDAQHKFILKIYDPENYSNGGVVKSPTVVTKLNVVIASTSAVLPGEVISDGGSNITQRGFYYSTDPLTQNIRVTASTYTVGPYTCGVYPLYPETSYYYKAFAKNEEGGESVGEICYFTTNVRQYTGATVTVNSSSASSHSLTINSEVIDIGYTPIITRGVVYQTGMTSTSLSDESLIYLPESGDVGPYSLTITGLSHETLYSYNAFAVNICGTTYGNSGYTTTKQPNPPVVTTFGYNAIYNSFDAIGELVSNDGPLNDPIHGIDELGILWVSGYTNPTIYDNVEILTPPYSLGQYTIPITGLTYGQTYQFKAFATNTLFSGDTSSTGVTRTVTIPIPISPTVEILGVTATTYTADISNHIISNGGAPIISTGLYYASGTTITPTVTTGGTYLSATGTTDWISNLTGLTLLTYYAAMAEVITAYGTGYSSIFNFHTLPIQTLPTPVLSFVSATPTGATLEGDSSGDGGSNIISEGILYSGVTTPGWIDIYGGNQEIWTSNITGLTSGETYYALPYAVNNTGYNTGDTITFTTPTGIIPPSFSLASPIVSNIGLTTVDITSEIVSDGGSPVTSRGLSYSGITSGGWLDWYGGTGSGSWLSTLTGLTSGATDYYVKAYATNLTGTTETPIVEFTTIAAVEPTIVINSITDITMTGATINSTVTSDGYDTVIERGLNLTGSTTPNWVYINGGVGSFSTILTGLTQNTSYTGQSYAINSIGTGYSNENYFETSVLNDTRIRLEVTSASSTDPLVYQVGSETTDIINRVTISLGNLTALDLWSGNTTFTATSTTGLTWGAGITSAISTPYSYSPIIPETQDFVAIESCGTPSEIISDTVTISAVYPFLTCNRVPENKAPIPDSIKISTWCGSGDFYNGNLPPSYEPMLKKIETKSDKTYQYTIGGSNNLIYFAYPSSYGSLTSIIVGGVTIPMTGPGSPTIYPNVSMASSGLPTEWNVLYNVYILMAGSSLGTTNIQYQF